MPGSGDGYIWAGREKRIQLGQRVCVSSSHSLYAFRSIFVLEYELSIYRRETRTAFSHRWQIAWNYWVFFPSLVAASLLPSFPSSLATNSTSSLRYALPGDRSQWSSSNGNRRTPNLFLPLYFTPVPYGSQNLALYFCDAGLRSVSTVCGRERRGRENEGWIFHDRRSQPDAEIICEDSNLISGLKIPASWNMSDFLVVMITMVIPLEEGSELWREDAPHGISSVWSFISICFGWWCSTYIPSLIHKNEHPSLPSCSMIATKSDPKESWYSYTRDGECGTHNSSLVSGASCVTISWDSPVWYVVIITLSSCTASRNTVAQWLRHQPLSLAYTHTDKKEANNDREDHYYG